MCLTLTIATSKIQKLVIRHHLIVTLVYNVIGGKIQIRATRYHVIVAFTYLEVILFTLVKYLEIGMID